jgi:hypothetical protein
VRPDESAAAFDRLLPLRQDGREELPDMDHIVPHVQRYLSVDTTSEPRYTRLNSRGMSHVRLL